MGKRKIITIIVAAAGCLGATVVGSLLMFSSTVLADTSIENKVLYNGLSTCYSSNQLKQEIDNTGTFTYGEISNNSGASIITLPTHNSNKQKLNINCYQLFSRLLNSNGGYSPEQLGYKASGNVKNDIKCMSVKYSYAPDGLNVSDDRQEADQVCFPVDGNNNVAITNANNDVTIVASGSNSPLRLRSDPSGTSANIIMYSTYCNSIENFNGSQFMSIVLQLSNGLSAQTIESDLAGSLNDGLSCMKNGNFIPLSDFTVKVESKPGSGQTSDKFTLDKQDGALTALRYITNNGSSSFNDFRISDDDYYRLYKDYIGYVAQAYPGVVTITNNCSTDKNAFTYAWTSDKTNWCEVKISGDVPDWFGGRPNSGGQTHMTPMQFGDILTSAKNIDLNQVDSGSLGAVTPGSGPSSGPSGGGEDGDGGGGNENSGLAVCYEGTGVLGWIACPVIELVGNATSYLYENFIEPSLQIQAKKIMNPNGPVGNAWKQFRDFANILFAIAFALVILAQLTGFGISNYNIKKILPRLIMVAVLVNISFILCQIAVDLSNILGVALKDFFVGLAEPVSGIPGEAKTMFGGIIMSLVAGITAVGATFTILGASVAVATLASWIFPIIIALLSCVIAVIFFFILLGVRQAGIVILVVLTPLAIVCYALPNTKSLFDKWKKMFTALLLLYPICGLMMGAGEYAGALLINLGDGGDMGVFYTLVAAMISVVPFFFIPSLLKQSMLAMGNIGAKISGLGNRLGRDATGAIRGSRFYQERQGEAQRRLNLKRDETRVDRLGTAGRGKSLIAKARRGLHMNTHLSRAQATRMAIAQSNLDRSTEGGAQVLQAGWESDGTASNIGDLESEDNGLENNPKSLVARYVTSTRRLFNDPTDHDALEEQKAAAKLLASSKPGRSQLQLANSLLASDIARLEESGTGKDKKTASAARQVMQRTSNNMRRTSGGDVAQSPILDEQVTTMQTINANYSEFDKDALLNAINKLSPKNVPSLSTQEMNTLLGSMDTLDDETFNSLTNAFSEALNDERYSKNFNAKSKPLAQRIASGKFNRRPSTDATATEVASVQNRNVATMAKASTAELGQINDFVQAPNRNNDARIEQEKTELMSTMSQTLSRALEPSSGVKLSAGQANQMLQTLSAGGYDLNSLAQQHGMANASQLQERLDILTGVKVQRPPRINRLKDHPENWRQATESDVTAAGGQLDGSQLRVGDWIKTVELSGPPTADGKTPTRTTRMSRAEVRAAEVLQNREAEDILQQSDASFAARQAWQERREQQQRSQQNQQQGNQQNQQNSDSSSGNS